MSIDGDRAHDFLVTFRERRLQVATHQSEPVAIYTNFVLGIDSRNRVLTVLNRRYGRFENNIRNVGRRVLAYDVARFDLYFNMQAVIAEQVLTTTVFFIEADELLRFLQTTYFSAGQCRDEFDAIGGSIQAIRINVTMTYVNKRNRAIQKLGRITNDGGTTVGVVARTAFLAVFLCNNVRSIKRVIQAAPAGIGRIDCESRVADRYDELRPCDLCDLGVNVSRRNLRYFDSRRQVTNFGQELDVFGMVPAFPGFGSPGYVPRIDFFL